MLYYRAKHYIQEHLMGREPSLSRLTVSVQFVNPAEPRKPLTVIFSSPAAGEFSFDGMTASQLYDGGYTIGHVLVQYNYKSGKTPLLIART